MEEKNIPALQQWMNKGEFLSLEGRQIFAIDEGGENLPVIVLIHGFPTSSWDFADIWKTLATNNRLICLDMLGFGFSDKPDKRNYEIHNQADLFDAMIKHSGVSEFHLLAHDYGVSVAQELLARQLDGSANAKCLSCCFLNGGLFPETHQALVIQKLLLGPLGNTVNRLLGFKMFSKAFSKVFGPNTKPTQQQLEIFWEIINYNKGKHVFHNLITYILDRREHAARWLEALRGEGPPLALINGSIDPISGSHLIDRYKELGCRLDYLAQLEHIGHYPQAEDPANVSMHYLKFLDMVGTVSNTEH